MGRIPGLTTVRDIFARFPAAAGPLLDYHEVVLRGPSAFTVAERELIAAVVSSVNACGYCFGAHARTAEAFGVDPALIEALAADLDTAPVDPKLKPVLAYVTKLTRTPSRMTDEDRQAVFDQGWDLAALHDAVAVCALFNFMNRMVEGMGLQGDPAIALDAASRLHAHGYVGLKRALEASRTG